jgi:hypothetical protein
LVINVQAYKFPNLTLGDVLPQIKKAILEVG